MANSSEKSYLDRILTNERKWQLTHELEACSANAIFSGVRNGIDALLTLADAVEFGEFDDNALLRFIDLDFSDPESDGDELTWMANLSNFNLVITQSLEDADSAGEHTFRIENNNSNLVLFETNLSKKQKLSMHTLQSRNLDGSANPDYEYSSEDSFVIKIDSENSSIEISYFAEEENFSFKHTSK